MSATTPGADRLAATTARLAGQRTSIDAADVDLLAAAGSDGVLWQHEGFGLAGRGPAHRASPRSHRHRCGGRGGRQPGRHPAQWRRGRGGNWCR